MVIGVLVLDRGAMAEGTVQPVGVEPAHHDKVVSSRSSTPPERSVVADALGLAKRQCSAGYRCHEAVTGMDTKTSRPLAKRAKALSGGRQVEVSVGLESTTRQPAWGCAEALAGVRGSLRRLSRRGSRAKRGS